MLRRLLVRKRMCVVVWVHDAIWLSLGHAVSECRVQTIQAPSDWLILYGQQ